MFVMFSGLSFGGNLALTHLTYEVLVGLLILIISQQFITLSGIKLISSVIIINFKSNKNEKDSNP